MIISGSASVPTWVTWPSAPMDWGDAPSSVGYAYSNTCAMFVPVYVRFNNIYYYVRTPRNADMAIGIYDHTCNKVLEAVGSVRVAGLQSAPAPNSCLPPGMYWQTAILTSNPGADAIIDGGDITAGPLYYQPPVGEPVLTGGYPFPTPGQLPDVIEPSKVNGASYCDPMLLRFEG